MPSRSTCIFITCTVCLYLSFYLCLPVCPPNLVNVSRGATEFKIDFLLQSYHGVCTKTEHTAIERISRISEPIGKARYEEKLSFDGYKEIGDQSTKKKSFARKCKVLKVCLSETAKKAIFEQTNILVLVVCLITRFWIPESVIFYLLIISGIEKNPGPLDNGREKKRFRKSGVQYKTYLTHGSSFENAPATLQGEVLHQQSDLSTPENEVRSIDHECSNIEHVADNVVLQINQSDVGSAECGDLDQVDYNCVMTENIIPEIENSTDEENDAHASQSILHYFSVEDSDKESTASIELMSEFITSDEENAEDETATDSEPDSESTPSYICDDFAKQLPIYDGAQLTLGASMLLLMTFVLNYNLTGEAFSDLLELVQLHCKESNILPNTVFALRKWFHELKISPKKHYYCSNCLIPVDENSRSCPNSKCNLVLNKKSDKSFFVEVSLIEQIKKLFAEQDFRCQLVDVSERERNKNDDTIEDIYDGTYYKECRRNKKMSSGDLTFTWNTDGVPLFKSSKTSMWPLFMCINELPYKIRSKPENLLLVGLWIGPKKPEMLTFLDPYIYEMRKLEEGIEIPISETSTSLRIRGFLISGTADLPAKCTVHNMVQFNGKYSCPHCMQPGETAKAGKGTAHVFPFLFEGPTSPMRTHEDSLTYAEKAASTRKPEWGIKGPCWLTQLTSYHFVKSNCIDYMHCVLLGVTKRLITLWFSKECSNERYSVYQKLEEVNEKISELKPPLYITRSPRPLTELKYWKASEFKSFLLYYGPVILSGILCISYYNHFLLFSEAIYLLLGQSITIQDIRHAENLLEQFIISFPHIYESRYLTLNFHLLLHLPENVRQLGPIWGYSCFPFENANGFLMKLVKGTQSVHSQLIDTMSIIHGLPYLEKHCIMRGSKANELLTKMKKNNFKKSLEIGNKIFAIGKITEMSIDNLTGDCFVAIANYLNSSPDGKTYTFNRLQINGNVFHSRNYTRVKVRNSFTVSFKEQDGSLCFGIVHFYVLYKPQNAEFETPICFAIITQLKQAISVFPVNEIGGQPQMGHMFTFPAPNFQEQRKAVNVENICKLCVFMPDKNGQVFVCAPPNSVEKE